MASLCASISSGIASAAKHGEPASLEQATDARQHPCQVRFTAGTCRSTRQLMLLTPCSQSDLLWQVAGQAAGSAAGAPEPAQPGGELELDDDELLELMDDEYDPAPAPAQAPIQTAPNTGVAGSALAGCVLLPITVFST